MTKQEKTALSRSRHRELPDAAKRALAEAGERRQANDLKPDPPKELNGRKGPEPTRYGDWEKNGIISDF